MQGTSVAVIGLGAAAIALGCDWIPGPDSSRPESPAAVESAAPVPGTEAGPVRDEPIRPIPLSVELDDRKVELGRRLFHETRFSSDGSISCASCHNLNLAGTDRKRFSTGVDGRTGGVNSPTVFNSGFNFKQFWDGRADTLEDQVEGPLHAENEMNSNWQTVVDVLTRDPSYASAFAEIYPDGIRSDNVKDAIAVFERSLYTPNSRFDKFLRGDDDAITEEEKAGFALFKSLGCVSCHQGVNVGGNMFETFGVMADYFADRGNMTEADLGRFNVTGREEDRHMFKVASLRNVALTPPYFHDGTARRLPDAVRVMAKYNLGRTLSDEQAGQIVAFLGTLTGEYQGEPLL